MKRISNKWLMGVLMGVLTMFGFSSCTDDHFDLNTTNATGTLWDNLVATNQANNFTKILEKTYVNRKSYGSASTITYKDLLSSSRVMTVWAPADGSYDADYWLNLLDQADNMTDPADRTARFNIYERVEKQFVRSYIANYNYNGAYAGTEPAKFFLMNSKYCVYDVANNTFNGASISNDPSLKNIACTNGTLHMLIGSAPYSPNLLELIENTPELSALNEYIASQDTLIFMEQASTPGAIVNGQIQYVDSAFYESNKILPGIASSEDSMVVAIYPSNTAYQEAIDKIKPFFNYKKKYGYMDSDAGKWVVDSINSDSLRDLHTAQALFNNMYYSLKEQPSFNLETASVETVKTFFETSDSLVSTSYYYASYDHHPHAPYSNTLTGGATPIEASNGYAFITDHFYFKANKSWQFDILLDAEDTWYLNQDKCKYIATSNPVGIHHSVTETNRNDSVSGKVRGNAYQEFQSGSASQRPTVAFNIPSVLSGTYDIYVVIVPENMVDKSNVNPKCNQFSALLEYDFDEKGKASTVTAGTTSDTYFRSDPTKVDTILLFENFKFPYCYSGISGSYPVLSLSTQMSIKDRTTVTPYLNIDCFIFKGKDE